MTWPSFISSLVELEQARRDGGQPQALPHRRYRDVEAGGDLFLVEPLLAQRHYTAKLVQRMHSKVIFKWPVSWMTLILRSFWLRLVFCVSLVLKRSRSVSITMAFSTEAIVAL